jgi:hypothetical protein
MSVTMPANVTLAPTQQMTVTLAVVPPAGVTLVQGGPRGPQGIPGPSGTAGASYIFTFDSPLGEWVCQHNLGRYPASILVYDAEGNVRPLVGISNPDINTTVLTPNPPLSGQVVIL